MKKNLIIYHGNCPDGFGAACAAFRFFQKENADSCDFYPASHGDPPPDCRERDVYILDFSYMRPLLKNICRIAESVTIIDHHITAQHELAGLEQEENNLNVTFDMEKSGAVLAWEFFHKTPPPRLLLHVQDRDLWRFELEESNDVSAALMSYPYDFSCWFEFIDTPEKIKDLISEGKAINRYRDQQIMYYKKKAVLGMIAGYQVPIVNTPRTIVSDLLGELANEHPFAAGYQDEGTKRKWSLRSRGAGGVDVSQVAQQFGGGGHRNASGFTTVLPSSLLTLVATHEEF
ncbi:MAG: phosphoesterase [Gammaproteobacteria bacterium]|nr:phosphoesterase [Gammaproteobacteria bacterium]